MALPAPIAAIVGQAESAVRSVGQTVALYAAIGLAGLIGAGFLLAALYIWLASLTDPLIAALLIGAVFLAIAGITLGVIASNARRRKEEQRRAAANAAAMASTLSLASSGLRIASRARGNLLFPLLGVGAVVLLLRRSGGRNDPD